MFVLFFLYRILVGIFYGIKVNWILGLVLIFWRWFFFNFDRLLRIDFEILFEIKIIDFLYLLFFNLFVVSLRRFILLVYFSKYTWIGFGFGVSFLDGFRLKLFLCVRIISIFFFNFMWRCKSLILINFFIEVKFFLFFFRTF